MLPQFTPAGRERPRGFTLFMFEYSLALFAHVLVVVYLLGADLGGCISRGSALLKTRGSNLCSWRLEESCG